MSSKKSIKLKDIIKEWSTQEENSITNEDKNLFFEKVKNFNSYGESIYAKGNLREVAEDLSRIAQIAEKMALNEEDWFDNVTISRNMKQLREVSKGFSKTAHEAQAIQERLSSLYEEMGTILNRYFTIEDIEETLNLGEPSKTQGAQNIKDKRRQDIVRKAKIKNRGKISRSVPK